MSLIRPRNGRHRPRRSAFLATLAAAAGIWAVLASMPRAEAKAPLVKDAKEYWFDFKFQGQKVGFLQSLDETTTVNERPAIHSKRWSVVTVRRQEQVIRMESTTDVWSDPDGRPMRYKHLRLEGKEARSSEGFRDGKELIVRHDIGGNLSERKMLLGDGIYFATSLDLVFNKDLKVGKALTGKAIVEEDGEVRDFSMKVTGKEKTADGEAFVIEGTVAGVTSRELVLPNGETLLVEIPGLGAMFTKTTREKAIQLDNPVDIFSSALFSVATPLPSGDTLEELVVSISGKSGKRPIYISDGRQHAKMIGDRTVELRIRTDAPPAKIVTLPIKTASVKQFLKETPYEAIKDERLTGTERRVVGDTKDAWEAARKINAFVYRHIEKKTLARAFATANEALETKEGDCTEHSVLFSALAKIAGIPTRLVTGLVYVGGRANVFGYHEWVEVWMGDRWIAMDPTFGQDIADPTHVKFTQGQSDPDGLRDAGLVAAALIGDLDFKVSAYTTVAGVKKTQ